MSSFDKFASIAKRIGVSEENARAAWDKAMQHKFLNDLKQSGYEFELEEPVLAVEKVIKDRASKSGTP